MRTATITLKGQTYKLRPSTGAAVVYEQLTGKPFRMETLTDEMTYLYAMLINTNRDRAITAEMDFFEFLDAMDESPDALAAFQELLREKRADEESITVADDEGTGNPENKKKD